MVRREREEVIPGVWRSSLPLARDVVSFAAFGGVSLVDMTQRERVTVARACVKAGVEYVKHPMPYDGGDYEAAVAVILACERPVLFHCFHGRDRTGRVAELIREQLGG